MNAQQALHQGRKQRIIQSELAFVAKGGEQVTFGRAVGYAARYAGFDGSNYQAAKAHFLSLDNETQAFWMAKARERLTPAGLVRSFNEFWELRGLRDEDLIEPEPASPVN